jgi:nitronate monooxygenase
LAYRCPSEPVNVYLAKGGDLEETVGRKCLCNCLLADIGLQQVHRNGSEEPGLVTTGDELDIILRFLPGTQETYSASTVVKTLMSQLPAQARNASTQASHIPLAPEPVAVSRS